MKPKEWQPPEPWQEPLGGLKSLPRRRRARCRTPRPARSCAGRRWGRGLSCALGAEVKAENPVTEWARGVSEVWAPDAPAPVEKEKTKANKALKEVKEPAKEPAKEPVKVEKKTAKVPKVGHVSGGSGLGEEKEEPKSEAKWIEKGADERWSRSITPLLQYGRMMTHDPTRPRS